MNGVTQVMIIEDDQAIAQLHQRYLEQMGGYQVIGIATSKLEAQMQLDIFEPDLLLLDVYLPDGTGLELLNALRAKSLSCDVILITAARDVDTLQQAMRGGVVDYLLKPVVFSRLEAALKKYNAQKLQFNHTNDLDQSIVDKMLRSNDGPEVAKNRLPKGIDSVTLEKIQALFNDHESLTADEAGEKIGASRTTARRYLEYLISSGQLEADLSYGSVGRPERTYRKSV